MPKDPNFQSTIAGLADEARVHGLIIQDWTYPRPALGPHWRDAVSEMPPVLECPCCGDDGAVGDKYGRFYDGQPLICGCSGWVSVGEDDVFINNGDEPCPPEAKCHELVHPPEAKR